MSHIENSWKINPNNPPNQSEVLAKINYKNSLNTDDNLELNSYRKSLVKDLINKKCSAVCLNSKDLNFKDCFDNCELKIQSAEKIFELSKNDYLKFKSSQLFV